ncbi:hypothetical protein Scinn_73690 [Streptomyces virginiae]|uniref:Uncharacterized protein n=1 Tax=Streptomyces virginiae TaxID=1961 RepID=A0ABQ3NYQ6_STRVG|nr:hypothetical protein Scinn_73690 [Streptomyces virginiae]
MLFWTLGGLGGARWDELALPAVALLVGGGALLTLARPLDLLTRRGGGRAHLAWTPDASAPPCSS